MQTNKFWSIMMMLVLVLSTTVAFSSCSDDEEAAEESIGNKSEKWYALQSNINQVSIRKSDFNEIEKAIDNHELLGQTYVTTGRYIYYYAERSMFVFNDGSFGTIGTTSGQKLGRLANTIDGSLSAIRIQDSNTLVSCHFSLFVDEDMNRSYDCKKYATVFNGHIFESISVYLSESYYTYIKTDNKIIVSNGDIYTVTSSGLIKDGYSSPMVQFNPKTIFGD